MASEPAVIATVTPKGFTRGTHRSCMPLDTWERIQPHLMKAGVTRVADITGLDRVGIPVTLAYRPDSPTMTSSTGKGLTLEAAMVSGAMEAIELYHAEQVELPVVQGSYEEMEDRGGIIALEDLPLTHRSVFTVRRPDYWVTGRDLLGGDAVAVPYALVAVWDPAFTGLDNLRLFQSGSNGLASGNDGPEAVTSALLEVIERDAVTCTRVTELWTGRPPPRIRLKRSRRRWSGPCWSVCTMPVSRLSCRIAVSTLTFRSTCAICTTKCRNRPACVQAMGRILTPRSRWSGR